MFFFTFKSRAFSAGRVALAFGIALFVWYAFHNGPPVAFTLISFVVVGEAALPIWFQAPIVDERGAVGWVGFHRTRRFLWDEVYEFQPNWINMYPAITVKLKDGSKEKFAGMAGDAFLASYLNELVRARGKMDS